MASRESQSGINRNSQLSTASPSLPLANNSQAVFSQKEPHTPMNRFEVTHLRKCFGDVVAIDDLSFHVDAGEIFGLIGPNGAGKSTCMMVIIGLLRPDAGTITFDGKPYDPRNAEVRSRLGFVPQELAIYPELTAFQNLSFFGGLYGLRGRRLKKRVDYVLDLTGLTANASHTLGTFSGGMARRLNFGIALLHEPKFVVLDEPTVGIDPQSRSSLLDCVRNLGKNGVGVIYASHYMEEVEAVCHRVAIIDRGRLLQQGTLDELLDRTRSDLYIHVESLPPDLVTNLRGVAKVVTSFEGETKILIHEDPSIEGDVRPIRLRAVLDLLEEAHVRLSGIETEEKSLETLFLQMTGRKLRD